MLVVRLLCGRRSPTQFMLMANNWFYVSQFKEKEKTLSGLEANVNIFILLNKFLVHIYLNKLEIIYVA